jgi:thiol-disulfide isomerase/thioredoxin
MLAATLTTQAPCRAADDPQARRTLESVAKAYRQLPAYRDRGEFRVAVSVDRGGAEQKKACRLTLVRPNLLRVETDPVTAVSDGKVLTTTVAATKRFATTSAPEVVNLETFRAGPLGSVLFGGPTERLAFILIEFLVGGEPVKSILAELDANPRLDGERAVDGKKYPLVLLDTPQGPDYRLVVDPETNLLTAIELVFDPKDAAGALPGESVAVARIDWRSGKLDTAVAKDELVGYKPPQGYTEVRPFDQAAGAQVEVPKHRVEDLVGQQAPDFSLTVMDPAGKFQTVTRDELAGKIVLLDFWATWCGPCLAELPEIQKMIEAYAKEKKDVVIVALSQDQQPSELGEVRKLVEKTLGEKKLELTSGGVGKVALDPSGTIGDAFQVEGYPTVVILDAKGVIQAAHVGFRPDVRETLTKDVDALLEGKSLVKARPKAKD